MIAFERFQPAAEGAVEIMDRLGGHPPLKTPAVPYQQTIRSDFSEPGTFSRHPVGHHSGFRPIPHDTGTSRLQDPDNFARVKGINVLGFEGAPSIRHREPFFIVIFGRRRPSGTRTARSAERGICVHEPNGTPNATR